MRYLSAFTLAALLGIPGALTAQGDCTCGLREVKESSQHLNRRSGLWLGIGAGGGAEAFNAYDGLGWSNDNWGVILYGKGGLTVNQNLTIGLQADLWYKDFGNAERTIGDIMIIGQLYPVAKGAFFLKGGGGWTRDQLKQGMGSSGPQTFTQDGWGVIGGLGYDIRISDEVSITPGFDLVVHRYDVQDERLLNFSLGLTFH